MSKKSLLGAICFVLFCGASANVFAQDAPTGAGASLLNPADPRDAGMGMASTAVNDNVFVVFGNAATTLSNEKSIGFGYSYNPVQSALNKGMATHAVGGYYNINDNNGIVIGFRYFRNAETELWGMNDDVLESLGTVRPSDMAISLGYTRRIVDNFTAALTVRYVSSNYSAVSEMKNGSAFAFDLGLYYNDKIESFFGSTWAVGLNVSNVGTKLNISDKAYTMPAYARLGGSIDMPFSENHRLMAALDLGYTFMPSSDASFVAGLGLEYNFFKYGIIRAGYYYGDEKALGGANVATFGLGVKAGPVRVDASYWLAGKDSPVKNTWSVGLSLFF